MQSIYDPHFWQFPSPRMAHPALLLSSWAMLLAHFAGIKHFGGPLVLQCIYLLGPCAGIWNHGSTSRVARVADRVCMALGLVCDLVWLWSCEEINDDKRYLCCVNLLCAVTCYFLAKQASGWQSAVKRNTPENHEEGLGWDDIHAEATVWHLFAHLYVTVAHLLILVFSTRHTHTAAADICLIVSCIFVWGRTFAFVFNTLVVYLAIGLPALAMSLFLFAISRPRAAQVVIGWAAAAFFSSLVNFTGVRVEVEGMENIDPREEYVFASNHVSAMDIPVLFKALRRRGMITVSKRSVGNIPIFGWLVWLGGSIFVSRGDPTASKLALADGARRLKDAPRPVLIFPEGRRGDARCKDYKLQALQNGVLYLSKLSGMRIVPVFVTGTQDIMGRGFLCSWVNPSAKVCVRIGKPLSLACGGKAERERSISALTGAISALGSIKGM